MATRRRPRTIRLRLTLLYTALFLTSGLVLVAVVLYVVFRKPILVTFVVHPLPPIVSGPALAPPPVPHPAAASPTWHTVRVAAAESVAVLAAMAAVSAGSGWFVAGRVLSPLRTMTAKTRLISERNLHERLALIGPRDEMTELADTVDGLLARLESAFQAQRRFIANASHELRTPLTMMRTSVDVAVGKPNRSGDVDVLAGKLREGLGAADRLLEGLLLLARAQNTGSAEGGAVSLSDLASAALRSRAGAVAEKDLTVTCSLEPVTVPGNPTLLASLVDNLVDNAIRHNEVGGWIRIALGSGDSGGSSESGGSRAALTVENGGAVLAQDGVDRLGQPFERLGAERAGRPGSGLGLSIAAAIASAHRGSLVLTARPEGGMRAEVTL